MSRLSAIILGATIALVQPQIALALSPQEVAKLAEKITVKIEDCGWGSGVIFDKQGNTYYVLTAEHVDINASKCLVITPDKIEHKIELANFQPIEGLDLAVVTFDSNNSYKVGEKGDSRLATIGTTVYIAGYAGSEVTPNKRTLRVSDGKIIGRPDEALKGYSLIYNSLTRDGMSGGPVLNADGKIIGIHGAADKKYGDKENYGIPIEKFIEVRGSSFWPIPSPPERVVPERSRRDVGLSWPLILLGGLAILGGGASLGYLFGWNTQSRQNAVDTAQPEERVPARYHKLRDLLAAGEWEKADEETARVMLQVAGRKKEGYFRRKDIEKFPCKDLRAIDKLWVKYSNGRFGFSVQKRIWFEEGGNVDWETGRRLADRVGWRAAGEWQEYSDLTFGLAAPTGHLPVWVMMCGVGECGVWFLLSRTDV